MPKSDKVVDRKPKPSGEESLGQFMCRRLPAKEIERILEKIDTHPTHGKGEKSRA